VSDTTTAARAVRLRDGSPVQIRPIAPEDKELVRTGFARLGPDSRYRRFLTPMARLSKQQLAYLTEVDHHDHEALVAIDPDGGDGLGVARFVRDERRPRAAEAAVTVIDDWQGRGLGTALLRALTDRAREEGIDRFTCLVLAENREMIELLERLGPVREVDRRPGTVEVAVDIPPAEEGIGAKLAQLLRAAAAGVAEFVAERTADDGGNADPRERP
jgi:RimJ/RimL family protein N-acetyltransferase